MRRSVKRTLKLKLKSTIVKILVFITNYIISPILMPISKVYYIIKTYYLMKYWTVKLFFGGIKTGFISILTFFFSWNNWNKVIEYSKAIINFLFNINEEAPSLFYRFIEFSKNRFIKEINFFETSINNGINYLVNLYNYILGLPNLINSKITELIDVTIPNIIDVTIPNIIDVIIPNIMYKTIPFYFKKVKRYLMKKFLKIRGYFCEEDFDACVERRKFYYNYLKKRFSMFMTDKVNSKRKKILTDIIIITTTIIISLIFVHFVTEFFLVKTIESNLNSDIKLILFEQNGIVQITFIDFSFLKEYFRETGSFHISFLYSCNEYIDILDAITYREVIPTTVELNKELYDAGNIKKLDFIFIEKINFYREKTVKNSVDFNDFMVRFFHNEFIKKIYLENSFNDNCTFDKSNLFNFSKRINYFSLYVIIFYLIISIILFIHSILSLYSVYVDYFQKTVIQNNSTRGFIPICIILILIFFILFSLFYYFFKFYHIKLLWIMFF